MAVDWDKIDMDEEVDTGESASTTNESQPEVTEVKMSKAKVAVICLVAAVVAIILILSFRGGRIRKKQELGGTQQPVQTQSVERQQTQTKSTVEKSSEKEIVDPNEVLDSAVEDYSKSMKNSSNSEVESNEVEEVKEVESSQSNKKPSGKIMQRVNEPVLDEVRETSALVSSKSVYNINDECYSYCVNLTVLLGNDNTVKVPLYCPRSTYDALETGDTVEVKYQLDSNGVVSINGISK